MNKERKRQYILNKDLIEYNPRSWFINLPFINYTLRVEDFIPAISGVIGKIALIAAFALAWSKGIGINDANFIIENVRLELVVGSVLTIIFCALLNPYAAPPGTLAPLIPIIPIMAASGVHPLPLGLLIGVIGFGTSVLGYFERILEVNGPGAKGGIILLFGFLGIAGSLDNLREWAASNGTTDVFVIVIAAGSLAYLLLNILNAKWLIIPLCAVSALIASGVSGIFPVFDTPVSFPLISPGTWWNEKWGIGWGISVANFIKALPFAVLSIVMWPTDALAIKAMQEANYPEEARRAVFGMNITFVVAAVRNLAGALLGGSQTTAIWRSFMIPLATVKRPIGGGAMLLGILGIISAISGAVLDIAVFPPLIWMVLIFGVYVPLLEVGLNTIKTLEKAKISVMCIIIGIALNPVLGWVTAIFVENFNLIKEKGSSPAASPAVKKITLIVSLIAAGSFLAANLK